MCFVGVFRSIFVVILRLSSLTFSKTQLRVKKSYTKPSLWGAISLLNMLQGMPLMTVSRDLTKDSVLYSYLSDSTFKTLLCSQQVCLPSARNPEKNVDVTVQ